MTIRAKRHKVCDWINLIFFSNIRKFLLMMNMNKALSGAAINLAKIKPTNKTIAAVMFNAP